MQTIYLDLFQKTQIPPLHATQRDVGRKFKAVFTNGAEPYPIPEDVQLSVWYSGTSGAGHYSSIAERSAFAVDGNTVTVELIAQMLVNKGKGELNLVLNGADGSQLGMWIILYEVEPLPGADSQEAQQYFDAFAEVTAQAMTAAASAEHAAQTFVTDPTLSISGKAADAAAVGTALAGKAPAGFGLGEGIPPAVSDANLLLLGGFYFLSSTSINVPFKYGTMVVLPRDNTVRYATQLAFSNSGTIARRVGLDYANWGEWEFSNPYLSVGTEYRTTERWNGNVVYKKIVDLGSLTNASEKTVGHGCALSEIIQISGKAYNSNTGVFVPIPGTTTYGTIGLRANSASILVYPNFDATGFAAYAEIKYIKD